MPRKTAAQKMLENLPTELKREFDTDLKSIDIHEQDEFRATFSNNVTCYAESDYLDEKDRKTFAWYVYKKNKLVKDGRNDVQDFLNAIGHVLYEGI